MPNVAGHDAALARKRDRLVRVQALAELVFGDAERARTWLHSPKERLGGATPMAFAADTLGFEAVQVWLHEIDQGYFS